MDESEKITTTDKTLNGEDGTSATPIQNDQPPPTNTTRTDNHEKVPCTTKHPAEVSHKSAEGNDVVNAHITDSVSNAVLECITSTSFKNEIALRIIYEVHFATARIVSQTQFDPAKHQARDQAQDQAHDISQYLQPSRRDCLTPGLRECVSSIFGCAIIQIREYVKAAYKDRPHNLEMDSLPPCNTVTEIVDSVFESMLDSLIPISDYDDVSQLPTWGSNMVGFFASEVFESLCKNLLQKPDLSATQRQVHKLRASDDKGSSITAQDTKTHDTVQEREDSSKHGTTRCPNKKFPLNMSDQIYIDLETLNGYIAKRINQELSKDAENVDNNLKSDEVAEEGPLAESASEPQQTSTAPSVPTSG